MRRLAFSCSSISPHPGRAPTSSFLFTHPPHPVIHSGCFADPFRIAPRDTRCRVLQDHPPAAAACGAFSQPAHAADARAPQVSSQIAAGRCSTPSPTPLRSHLAPSLVRSASHSDEQRYGTSRPYVSRMLVSINISNAPSLLTYMFGCFIKILAVEVTHYCCPTATSMRREILTERTLDNVAGD